MPQRGSIAGGARQRDTAGVEARIAKALGIPPPAKAVGTILVRAFGIVPDLADDKRAVIGAESGPGGIGQLRAADPGAGRVAIKQTEKNSESFLRVDEQARGRGAERVRRAARGQVERGQGRPAERRVDE